MFSYCLISSQVKGKIVYHPVVGCSLNIKLPIEDARWTIFRNDRTVVDFTDKVDVTYKGDTFK